MSSAASTSKTKADEKPANIEETKDTRPHLGVLEEDDEFEEFAAAGEYPCLCVEELEI